MRELSPGRRRILEVLGAIEWTSTELAAALGRQQANVSRDLRIMYKDGLVTRRRDGLHVYYRKAGAR